MPVGADVRKALRRGSDVGAMLVVGGGEKIVEEKEGRGGKEEG